MKRPWEEGAENTVCIQVRSVYTRGIETPGSKIGIGDRSCVGLKKLSKNGFARIFSTVFTTGISLDSRDSICHLLNDTSPLRRYLSLTRSVIFLTALHFQG